MNTLVAVNLLLGLAQQMAQISAMIAAAQAQGRDLTAEELATLTTQDDASRKKLQADIDAAKAAGK